MLEVKEHQPVVEFSAYQSVSAVRILDLFDLMLFLDGELDPLVRWIGPGRRVDRFWFRYQLLLFWYRFLRWFAILIGVG